MSLRSVSVSRVITAHPELPKSVRSPLPDWLAFALFAIVAARMAVRASGPVNDPDTWWHLRLGEEFRGSWSIAHPGTLSPFATKPWFATQWTLEVVASRIQDAFGLAGVSWFSGVGLVVLAVSLYMSCRQRGTVAAAAIASSLALAASSMSHGPRPQMASFIFAAIFTAAWLRTMNDLKPRWWLVPLVWVWACTHGMWFIGVLVGVFVVAGLAMDGRLTRRAALKLVLVPLGGLLAAALTPVGPKLILAPLATSKMAGYISEWDPPDFSMYAPAVAALMIAAVVVTWARGGVRRSWADVLLLALAVGWILLYFRTVALGAVIVAPLVTDSIQSWLPADRLRVPRWEGKFGIVAALAIVAGLGAVAPWRGPVPLEQVGRIDQALSRLPSGTVVFNDYGLGGWLEWKHRNVSPVIDGMTDAYEVSYVGSYLKTARLGPGWRNFMDRTDPEYALLDSKTPLAVALAESNQWETEVRQSGYVLLRRTSVTD